MSLALWNLDGFEPFDQFQIEPYWIKFLSHFYLLSIQIDKYEIPSAISFFPSQLLLTRFTIPSTHYSSQSWQQSLLPYSIQISKLVRFDQEKEVRDGEVWTSDLWHRKQLLRPLDYGAPQLFCIIFLLFRMKEKIFFLAFRSRLLKAG